MSTGFAEDHYRNLFQCMDQGLCTIELIFDEHDRPVDYRFVDVNPAFERHCGIKGALGRCMRELAPAHEQHWFDTYGRVALTGEPVRFESEAASLGRWFDVVAFRNGEPDARQVTVLFHDITTQKRAERNHYASEARYRALAHATANAIYRMTADGNHLLEVSGGSMTPRNDPALPLGRTLTEYVHPDDHPRTQAAWQASVATGKPFEMEHRSRMADGTWGWVLSRAVPVRDEAGTVIEWIGSATDITRRKEMEAALRESEADHRAARGEAESASRAKDQFMAMLAHELRNPLAPMLTALQLMRMRGGDSNEQRVLERQVAHLTRLVSDLLDMSRIANGRIELEQRPMEICAVVARAVELAGVLLQQRHHQLDVQVPRRGLGVNVDPDRMTQVVANLLMNAAKYSEPGSRIVVKASRDGANVCLSVKDEGVGIPGELLERIFGAFVQRPQSSSRAEGGLGLGLAIVRNLVSAHGGSVWAKSEGPNRGSELIVELPAVDVVPEPPSETAVPARRTARALRNRILVVDDNRDAAIMLRVALEQLDYLVEMAFDGPSALACARTFEPHLGLLDIGLPGMDGYELAARLREAQPAGSDLTLIAVTGYGQESDERRSLEAGFDRHLVKPVDLDVLQRTIEEHLR
jgi:signal transduction histidine kinase